MIEALETKHYATAAGEYLGGFAGVRRTTETPDPETGDPVVEVVEEWPPVPAGAVEIDGPPDDAQTSRWDGSDWVAKAPAEIAAEKQRAAEARLSANPELSALIAALSERLSLPTLARDVADRLR